MNFFRIILVASASWLNVWAADNTRSAEATDAVVFSTEFINRLVTDAERRNNGADRDTGQYRAKVKPDMAGDWKATLRYDGPRGNGSVSVSVNVKQ